METEMTEISARSFNPNATRPERALQAWQILISHAANRQTITYDGLGYAMYDRKAAGVHAQTLDMIARFCQARGLPPLNSVVVGSSGGRPGAGIPSGAEHADRDRELVYGTAWFTFVPPTLEELAASDAS